MKFLKRINWDVVFGWGVTLFTGCLFWAGVVWWIYEATK